MHLLPSLSNASISLCLSNFAYRRSVVTLSFASNDSYVAQEYLPPVAAKNLLFSFSSFDLSSFFELSMLCSPFISVCASSTSFVYYVMSSSDGAAAYLRLYSGLRGLSSSLNLASNLPPVTSMRRAIVDSLISSVNSYLSSAVYLYIIFSNVLF